jgi:hypothetical protein
MATAAETYIWATYGTALKAYLGISGSAEDASLTLWLAAAAEDCDDYVGPTAFVDDDGEDVTHPVKIRVGIYEWVGAMRAWRARAERAGLASVSTGALSESYSGDREGMRLARAVAASFWGASVADVSLMGGK